MEEIIDDGGLGCLNIPVNKDLKRFNNKVITQQELINRTFWVIDYFTNVKTKYGLQYLVKIKFDLNGGEDDTNARKFFTGSSDIKYILDKLDEMDKFPRRVTMKVAGNRYYFE